MNNSVTVVLILMTLTGVLFAVFKIVKSSNWEATTGVVLESAVEKIYRAPSDNTPDGRTVEYKLVLKYKYTVKDAVYYGDKLYAVMPNITASTSEAERLADVYAAGKTVDVYYDPQNPQRSALIAGKEIPVKAFVIMGAFAIVVAALIIVGYLFMNKISPRHGL